MVIKCVLRNWDCMGSIFEMIVSFLFFRRRVIINLSLSIKLIFLEIMIRVRLMTRVRSLNIVQNSHGVILHDTFVSVELSNCLILLINEGLISSGQLLINER